MIDIKPLHFEIIKNVFQKYDYSFYLFGSRLKGNAKEFSDIDLTYLEHIQEADLIKIEEDFEESDLPYKVDLVDYNKCSKDFRAIIKDQYFCIHPGRMLLKIEDALLGHFKFIPKSFSDRVYQLNGVSLINCGLGSSMFNVVLGMPDCSQTLLKDYIGEIVNRFNKQPFTWWIPTSMRSKGICKKLTDAGLKNQERECLMVCDLIQFKAQDKNAKLSICQVLDKKVLVDFTHVIANTIDSSASDFYKKFEERELNESQKFFVGYTNKKPVTVCTLFIKDDICCLFNLVTAETNRRKGFATTMMVHVLNFAKNQGASHIGLLASGNNNMQLYKKLGFREIGEFDCFKHL